MTQKQREADFSFKGIHRALGQKNCPLVAECFPIVENYKEFFKVGAGLKPTVLLALILISSPV